MFGFGRKRAGQRSITREQALGARPVRNPELGVDRNDAGEVELKRPRRRTWWVNLLAKVGTVPEYQTLTLDKVGSAVWDLCDGEHTVRELIEQLAEEHQLSRKEAEVSMVTYLRQLAQRGIIALAVEPAGEVQELSPKGTVPGGEAEEPEEGSSQA